MTDECLMGTLSSELQTVVYSDLVQHGTWKVAGCKMSSADSIYPSYL